MFWSSLWISLAQYWKLNDMLIWILQVLLHKLEESDSEQTQLDQGAATDIESLISMEDEANKEQPGTGLDETQIRKFLSAKDLKSLRNDSSKKSSSCFGRRMDRIGSMSSLGCNTIGRYSKCHCKKAQHHGSTIIQFQCYFTYHTIQWNLPCIFSPYLVLIQIQNRKKDEVLPAQLWNCNVCTKFYFHFYFLLFIYDYLLGIFWLSKHFSLRIYVIGSYVFLNV